MKTLYKIAVSLAFIISFAAFASAQTEREKGIESYLNGDYPKAVQSLQQAVEADKTNQEAWLYLGMAFARLKSDDKATDAFKRAENLALKTFAENEKDAVFTKKPRAQYTDAARENNVNGTVTIAIELKADGTLGESFVVAGLPSGLTRNVVKAVRKIEFKPATKDGAPVLTIKIVKYSFTIY